MNRLLGRSPWLNPLRKRNNSNLDKVAKANEYTAYVEKKFPHLILSDKSIVLFECPLDNVFQRFRSKYLSVRLFGLMLPIMTVYYSTLEYERIEMWGTLEDWVKKSPRKNLEGWVKINEALEFFLRLSAISIVVGYILKERLLMKSGRFVTHCLFNYQEKSLIFRTSDFRQKHGKFLKVPLNKVKWECKEGYAPPPTFFKQTEGNMYGNAYGFSSVNVTLPNEEAKSDEPLTDTDKSYNTDRSYNVKYRQIWLKLRNRGKNSEEETTEKFFIANGSHADESAFNEFITKMDLTGDPKMIIQKPDKQWHGLQNQTNLDGFDNKFSK